jgi:diketogulonate reductase-like aldo/keto reductase
VWKDALCHDEVITSAHDSLKRLQIDYIDLLCIHAPNTDVPLTETISALDELVDQGFVKYIGVSNFSIELLHEAESLTRHKIVTNQIEYNLLVREKSHFHNLTSMESEIIPYCQANDILVTATVPLARGAVLEQNDLMDGLAEKYNKSYAQIAINWLTSQKNIVTIVKAETKEHLQENLASVGWDISKEDIEKLRQEYPVRQ